MRRFGWKWLVKTGLYDLFMPPKVSPELAGWIADFRPEVIYGHLTDLGYMRFALMLHKRLGLPICVHVLDDWPNTHYRGTWLSGVVRPVVNRTFRRLLAESSARLTIGKEMERDYRPRYGMEFEALMCCEEPERYEAVEPRRDSPAGEITIAYCGNLYVNRWKSLLDLLEVVEGLWQQGVKVWVDVYSSYYPPEAAEALAGYPHLRFRPTPHSTAVPGILKGADILFHTESFDPTFRPYIRLSVSSKSQIYMLSRVPVLMYGPPEVSVVAYARETGWAYVVDRPDRTLLREAVVSLGRENELRERLVKRAIEVFDENHDARVVRERLRHILQGSRVRRACKGWKESHSMNGVLRAVAPVRISMTGNLGFHREAFRYAIVSERGRRG